jgi:hypothetical protein
MIFFNADLPTHLKEGLPCWVYGIKKNEFAIMVYMYIVTVTNEQPDTNNLF